MYIHNNNIFCNLHCIHYNIHIYIATVFGPMVVYIYIYIYILMSSRPDLAESQFGSAELHACSICEKLIPATLPYHCNWYNTCTLINTIYYMVLINVHVLYPDDNTHVPFFIGILQVGYTITIASWSAIGAHTVAR